MNANLAKDGKHCRSGENTHIRTERSFISIDDMQNIGEQDDFLHSRYKVLLNQCLKFKQESRRVQ